MRRHATDRNHEFTMCGRLASQVKVDDGLPDCRTCLAAIKARCEHGERGCPICRKAKMMEFGMLAVLVFTASVCIDFCHAWYVNAINSLDGPRAGLASAAQWLAGTIGFVVAVKISLWLLPFECLGLYVGTRLAVYRLKCVTL